MIKKLRTSWAHEKATSFTTELITNFALAALLLAAHGLLARIIPDYQHSFRLLIMSVNGLCAVKLTVAIINFFGFRALKKKHSGKKYNKTYYNSLGVRRSLDDEERWNSMHQPRH